MNISRDVVASVVRRDADNAKLNNIMLTPNATAKAANATVANANPLSQNAYKIQLMKAMVRRALERLI